MKTGDNRRIALSATRFALLPVTVALSVGLVACGGDASPAPNPSNDPSGEVSTEPEAELSPTECLRGTWDVDNDFFLGTFNSVVESLGTGTELEPPTGDVDVTFSDPHGYKIVYNDWTLVMHTDAGDAILTRDGTDLGDYEANDVGELTMNENDMGSIVTLEAGGGTLFSRVGEPITWNVTFVCNGDELLVTRDDETSQLHRK